MHTSNPQVQSVIDVWHFSGSTKSEDVFKRFIHAVKSGSEKQNAGTGSRKKVSPYCCPWQRQMLLTDFRSSFTGRLGIFNRDNNIKYSNTGLVLELGPGLGLGLATMSASFTQPVMADRHGGRLYSSEHAGKIYSTFLTHNGHGTTLILPDIHWLSKRTSDRRIKQINLFEKAKSINFIEHPTDTSISATYKHSKWLEVLK